MEKVILYGTKWCPWCLRAKSYFENEKIEFVWKDADVQENTDELFRKTKQSSIPVIDIDGNIVVGFDQEKIKHLLNQRK